MDKKLNIAVVTLPFAFLFHNIEEAMTMEAWMEDAPVSALHSVTVNQFAVTVGLFSILGFVSIFAKRLYRNERQYVLIVTGFSGMLLLNVFFPHLLSAFVFRKYTPGLGTSLLINLPLTTYMLYKVRKASLLSTKQMTLAVLVGGLVGITLIYAFLFVGEMIYA